MMDSLIETRCRLNKLSIIDATNLHPDDRKRYISIAKKQHVPIVRALAADVGVNMHTVNKSYHELEKRGIIRIIPKSGAVINSPKSLGQERDHFRRLAAAFRPVIAEALVLGIEEKEIEGLAAAIIQNIKQIG